MAYVNIQHNTTWLVVKMVVKKLFTYMLVIRIFTAAVRAIAMIVIWWIMLYVGINMFSHSAFSMNLDVKRHYARLQYLCIQTSFFSVIFFIYPDVSWRHPFIKKKNFSRFLFSYIHMFQWDIEIPPSISFIF